MQQEETVFKEHSQFYRDSRKQVIIILTLMIMIGISLAFFMTLQLSSRPKPKVFYTNPENALIQEAPLSEPQITENVLLNWVTEVMTAGFSFNFIDMAPLVNATDLPYALEKTRLAELKPSFFKEGFESYKKVVVHLANVDQIVKQKFIIKAEPKKAPIIEKTGLFEGKFVWRIKLPIEIRYYNVDTDSPRNLDLTLFVIRVPNTVAPQGVQLYWVKGEKVARY